MIVGDAANFLLGGIPGDLHDEFVMDVEPADLVQASGLLAEMSDSVRTIHVRLSGSVASLEGRWQGDGAAAFDSEIWQPLSRGLGVLERECRTAAGELAKLAQQAVSAHLYKVEELNQEIQTQLYIFAGTSLIGSPELGGVISEAVGGLAARLGGELVGRIVVGIVDAISALLRTVQDALYDLLKWVAKPVASAIEDVGGKVERILARRRGDLQPAIDTQTLDSLPAAIAATGPGRVPSAAQKLSALESRYGPDVASKVLETGARYVDRENAGNIDIFLRRPDGDGFIRVTLDPSGKRVISAGLNTNRNVMNGISRGRFIRIP